MRACFIFWFIFKTYMRHTVQMKIVLVKYLKCTRLQNTTLIALLIRPPSTSNMRIPFLCILNHYYIEYVCPIFIIVFQLKADDHFLRACLEPDRWQSLPFHDALPIICISEDFRIRLEMCIKQSSCEVTCMRRIGTCLFYRYKQIFTSRST